MAFPVSPLAVEETPSAVQYPRLVYDGGGPTGVARPSAAVDNGVLGMALFLATETMLFAGLISAFLILRSANEQWPPPGQPRLPIEVTGLNTLVLLLSGATMRRATGAARRQYVNSAMRWLSATALLGLCFLIVQGWEWVQLLRYGLTVSSGTFGATFYTLIGCHALHVAAAVATLLLIRLLAGRFAGSPRKALEVVQLYWFFVVAVWPILYVLVYCI